MVTTSEIRTEAAFGELEELRDRPSLARRLGTFVRKQPLGTAGAVVVIVYIVVAILAPWIAPFDPVASDYSVMLQPPPLTSATFRSVFGSRGSTT